MLGGIQGRGSLGGRGVSGVDSLVDLVVIDVQDGDLNRFRNLTSTILSKSILKNCVVLISAISVIPKVVIVILIYACSISAL